MIRKPAVLMVVTLLASLAKAQDSRREPVRFEPVPGDDSSFIARCAEHTARFDAAGATFGADGDTVRMTLVGGNPRARAMALEPVESLANYLIGRDANAWRVNVRGFRRVRFEEVYPGIDLIYSSRDGRLVYDFVVRAGAEPERIRLRFDGAEEMRANAAGELEVRTAHGEYRHRQMHVYQTRPGGRQKVEGQLAARGMREAVFEIGAYDRSRTLTIDPTILYSTYLGGRGHDTITGMAVDRSANSYVAGWTETADFLGVTAPGVGASVTAYVAKFNPVGGLMWVTYFGGSRDDRAFGIAVDASGCTVVTGWTYSSDFPLVNAAQRVLGGGRDAFVAKLSAAGTALVFSTYLGGEGYESGNGIALDAQGKVYIAGETGSFNFPVLGAVQAASGGGLDAFVAMYTATGERQYATYFGGVYDDRAMAVALDASSNVYATGSTESPNFPVTAAFQGKPGGGQDAFVLKLNSAGTAVVYSGYLGGSASESGSAIAVDPAGSAHIAGSTSSTNFPLLSPARASLGGAGDAFVAKLGPSGTTLVYATYLGGSGLDYATGIALDPTGAAHVVGYTASADFPVSDAAQGANAGGYDAFVARLSPSGSSVLMATYLGGTGSDAANTVALDDAGNIYLAGQSQSADFPTANAIQVYRPAAVSAFVAKIGKALAALPVVASGAPAIATATPQTFTAVAQDGDGYGDIYRIYFLVNPTPSIPLNTCHGFYDVSSNGFYLYNDAVTQSGGPLMPGSASILQNSQCMLYGQSSSATAAGTEITLNLTLGLKAGFGATPQKIYIWVKDRENHDTGWVQTGTWVLSRDPNPSVVSGSPATARGVTQTFSFTARDPDGYIDIYRVYFLINPSATIPQNTCHGYYDRSSNTFSLYNDAVTTVTSVAAGGSGVAQNSQCIVYGSGSIVTSAAGTDLMLTIAFGLQAGYRTANQKVYLWVKDNEGHDTGWVQTGTWAPATDPNPSVASGSPAVTSGAAQTFTFTARDPDGYTDIYRIYFLINPTATIPQNTCHGYYDRSSNTFSLYNDAVTAVTSVAAGGSGVAQNSQCIVYAASSRMSSAAGTDLTLDISFGLQTGYNSVTQRVYLWVKDNEGHDTGWIQTGAWTAAPNQLPAVISAATASVGASTQTFTVTARDPDGYTDIYRIYFLVNPNPAIPQNTCHGYYDRASNTFWLYNDSLSAITKVTPGSAGVAQNGQCQLYGSSSGLVAGSGPDLVLSVGLGLQTAYQSAGQKVYFWVKDSVGHDTGWVQTGSW